MIRLIIFIIIHLLKQSDQQTTSECYMGSVNFMRTSNVRPLDTVLEQIKQKLQISSLRCHQKCIDTANCKAYLYDSNALNCYLITNDNLRINHQNLFKAPGWTHHSRICLTSDSICNQQWAFESYGSTQFNSIADKIVTNLNSEETCLNACSNEKQFICRSAVYDHLNKTCSLHSNNRNTAPDLFADQQQGFSSNLLYIENLCVQQGCEIWRTHLELISGMQAIGAQYTKRTDNLQPSECIEMCKKENTCKSINIDYKEGVCEFYDEQNTMMDIQQQFISKDQEQQMNSVQQTNQFSIQHKTNNIDHHMNNNQQLLTTGLQIKNRSLNNFQNDQKQSQQNNYLQQNLMQQSINEQRIRIQLKPNPNVNYFVKTCLTELNSCDTHWSFQREIGKRLELMNSEKNLDGLYYAERLMNTTTREQCQSACLKYSLTSQQPTTRYPSFASSFKKEIKDNFVCRSLNFNTKTGACKLFSFNQHTTFGKPIKLESDKPNYEYIENSCMQETRGFCNWKTSYQKRILFADRVIVESNLTSCKEKCLKQSMFNCRSLSFDPETSLCALSHHSSISMPSEAVTESSNAAVYSEVATCFKVNVECRATDMIVKLNANMPFKGRIYARGNPKNCSLDVNNSLDFDLSISLNETTCGTIFQHDNSFSNILVIQGNDQVLTSLDKAIGVKCSYDLDSITGEAVLFINELPLTDTGRSSADLPDLSLHVIDINGFDRSEVALGELLKVQVKLSDEDTYGVFIRNLIAKDGDYGIHNLTLIDKFGCPVQTKVMKEVKRINSKTKQLESYFEAFSFTGSNTLVLEGEIETCLNNCLPVQCQVVSGRSNDDFETVVSYGRRKREYNVLDSKILTQSIKIRVADFEQSNDQNNLNYVNNQMKKFKGKKLTNSDQQLFLVNDIRNQDEHGKTQTNYVINDFGQFCFEPTLLAILSGFTLIVQGCFFFCCYYTINSSQKKFADNILAELINSIHKRAVFFTKTVSR